MTKKVCISGYYGFDNFGDETILKILTENLKTFNNVPEITVFSSNPQKTASELNVNSVQSFNLKEIIKELKACDCLISGGGSLLQDATSNKSLIYYLGVIGLAIFLKKDVIIFAQGIGPINNKLLEKITFFLLKYAKLITVRDDKSKKLLESKGIQSIQFADPVWNLEVSGTILNDTLGVQLRSYPCITDNFLNQLAINITKYFQNKKIYLFSLQNKLDLPICKKLEEKLKELNPDGDTEIIENNSNEEIIKKLSSMEELISMRYHACLIGIKSGIKVLPINYDIKVEGLAKDFNLDCIMPKQNNVNEIFESFIKKKIVYDREKTKNLKFDFKLMENAIQN